MDKDQDLVFQADQDRVFAGLGGDGRLAELGKVLKANEPVPELGEEGPLATEPVSMPRGAPVGVAELADEGPEPAQGGDQQGGGVELAQETDAVKLDQEADAVKLDQETDAVKLDKETGQVELDQETDNTNLDQETGQVKFGQETGLSRLTPRSPRPSRGARR